MALPPGTRLGVYEIIAPIGEGGMGQVYRATDTKLKRHVAIKILPPSLATRDIYLDAAIRLQVFELFFGGDPFGRDLAYLVRLGAARKIDPQLAGELPWGDMPAALDRLRNRDVAGKLALTVGD